MAPGVGCWKKSWFYAFVANLYTLEGPCSDG